MMATRCFSCCSLFLFLHSILAVDMPGHRTVLDFSRATPDPQTGQLCVMQQVCIADLQALANLLPATPCLNEGCSCTQDSDCPAKNGRCVACNCMDCPESSGREIINPPLTFLIDTTRSVKPDKDSIFNLTQRVVNKIETGNVNIPNYQLVTFNDYGDDIRQNVRAFPPTQNVEQFKSDTLGLIFESFDGGRDSKERLTQGLLVACQQSPEKALIVVFTDNGSKDLQLRDDILKIKEAKQQEVYIVLTPEYEGRPDDPSLGVYDQLSVVFHIADVGAETLINRVQQFEESNCL